MDGERGGNDGPKGRRMDSRSCYVVRIFGGVPDYEHGNINGYLGRIYGIACQSKVSSARATIVDDGIAITDPSQQMEGIDTEDQLTPEGP